MKNNKKTIAIIVALLIVVALAVVVVFRTDREELTEDVVVEVQEVDTLDVVGAGGELVDIEKDIYNLDRELEIAEQLLNQLDVELENL